MNSSIPAQLITSHQGVIGQFLKGGPKSVANAILRGVQLRILCSWGQTPAARYLRSHDQVERCQFAADSKSAVKIWQQVMGPTSNLHGVFLVEHGNLFQLVNMFWPYVGWNSNSIILFDDTIFLIFVCTCWKRMNLQLSLSRWLMSAAKVTNSLLQVRHGQWYSFC